MSDEQTTNVQPTESQPVAAESQPVAAESQPVAAESQGIPAVGMLVAAFMGEQAADQAIDAMKDAKRRGEFYFEDAAVIRKDAKGKVHAHEIGDVSTGRGAAYGAIIGGVLGLLGGPAGVALGAGAGAAIGGVLAHGDAGFRDESIDTVGGALVPGSSAVAVITSDAFLKAVQQAVPAAELDQAVANLAARVSERLNAGMDLAIGLILTPDGLGIKEVAVGEDQAEVTGAVITDEAVALGVAVATPEGVAYVVAVGTEEAAVVEQGVVTDQGAVVVTDVITDQGETVVATAAVPVMVTETVVAESSAADATEAKEATETSGEAADAPKA